MTVRIENLKAMVDEGELNGWLAQQAQTPDLHDLQVSLTQDRVTVKGVFRPSGMLAALVGEVPFVTSWEPGVRPDGRCVARLCEAEARGLPANMLRQMLLDQLGKRLPPESGVQVEGDGLVANAQVWLARLPVRIEGRLRSLVAQPGCLVLEAGA